MAQNPGVTCNELTWTRLDTLPNHTLAEIQNQDGGSLGVLITQGAPGGNPAWNGAGARVVQPGGDWMIRLAIADQLWGKLEKTASAGIGAAGVVGVYEAV